MREDESDAALWLEAISGTERAFVVIFDRYRARVFRSAYRRVWGVSQAEEAVAIVFLRPQTISFERLRISTTLGKDGVMTPTLTGTGRAIAEALEEAHAREDVEQYVRLFSAGATWVTSRGALFVGRDDLHAYLAQVMPGGLAGGSVSYRVAETTRAGDAVVVVIDQEYRGADGELKSTSGRHRQTYVVVQANGGWEIAAGQNTTVADKA